MAESFSNRRLAEMWCELNVGRTPREIKTQRLREFTEHKEFYSAMAVIEAVVKIEYCMEVWRELHCQDFTPTKETTT